MRLSDITDDHAFIAFLYSMYLNRIANNGEPEDYYSVEIHNQLLRADVRVEILKIPDEEEKQIMEGLLGVDIDKIVNELKVLTTDPERTEYENWHYQIYNSKERYDKDVKKYEKKIREFFEGYADMVEFNVDQDFVKVRGEYEKPIPPKLLMEFCDKFGYYSPTLDRDWIGDSIFTHVHYRFNKKANKNMLKEEG